MPGAATVARTTARQQSRGLVRAATLHAFTDLIPNLADFIRTWS